MYSYFEDTEYVYLVLELCHNGELQKYLKKMGKGMLEEEGKIDLPFSGLTTDIQMTWKGLNLGNSSPALKETADLVFSGNLVRDPFILPCYGKVRFI